MEAERAKGLIMVARAHWFAEEAGAAGTAAAAAAKPAAAELKETR